MVVGNEAVTTRIEQLLAMRSLEFRRAVVIPQGQFRQFLVAEGPEKEQILRSIFGTGRFLDLENLLDAEQRRLSAETRTAWDERERLVREATGETGGDFHDRLHDLRARAQKLESDLLLSQRLEEDFRGRVGSSAVFQERSNEMQGAREALEALEEREQQLGRERARLDRYGRAAEVQRYLQQYDEARRTLEEAELRLDQAQTAVTQAREAEEHPDAVLGDLESAQRQQSRLQHELERLDRMSREYRALQTAVDQLEEIRDERARLEQAMSGLDEDETDCRQRLEQNLGLRGQGEELRRRSVELRQHVDVARRALKRTRQSEEVEQTWNRMEAYAEKAASRMDELHARSQQLRRELQQLEQALWHGQAGHLAQRLERGEPCPVCGSPVHPSPASPLTGSTPTPRDLEAKRAQMQQAEGFVAKLQREQGEQAVLLARLSERKEMLDSEELDSSTNGPGAPQTSREWEHRAHHLGDELRRTERQLTRLGDLEQEIRRLQVRLGKIESIRHKSQEALHQVELESVQLETIVREKRAHLSSQDESLESFEQLESQQEQVRRTLESTTQSLEAQKLRLSTSTSNLASRMAAFGLAEQLLRQARETAALTRELFEMQLTRAGFGSRQEVQSSLEELAGSAPQVSAAVQAHDGALEAARDRLDRARSRIEESVEHGAPALSDLESLRERIANQLEERAALRVEIEQLEQWTERYHQVVD